MTTTRSGSGEHLLLKNTMRITEGHLEEFRAAIRRSVEFVEANGPQLMVQVFIDEEAMLAHSFQLYADSAAILRHWELSDHVISDVMRHCTVERLEMYGEPDRAVADGLRGAVADHVPHSTLARHIGYLRCPGRPIDDGRPGGADEAVATA